MPQNIIGVKTSVGLEKEMEVCTDYTNSQSYSDLKINQGSRNYINSRASGQKTMTAAKDLFIFFSGQHTF